LEELGARELVVGASVVLGGELIEPFGRRILGECGVQYAVAESVRELPSFRGIELVEG
jgi:hypothetical protein